MPKAALTTRMISDFRRVRLVDVREESERSAVCRYLTDLLELLAFPPYRGRWIDWAEVAIVAGIEKERLQGARHKLQPVFDAVSRAVALLPAWIRLRIDEAISSTVCKVSRMRTGGKIPVPTRIGPR